MWWGIDVSGPYPSMKGYLICTLFAWFNPWLPNFANSFLRAVFTNQGVYILPKVLIANMADFGNVPISTCKNFAMLQKCIEASHNCMARRAICNTFFSINCALCSLETLS